MSVQQIDPKVLNAFGSRLVTIGNRKTCDEWHPYSCRTFLTHGDVWDIAEKTTKMIADMNALNWSKRYNEECISLSDFVKIGQDNLSIYQFLKTLQYIMYNTFDYEECFDVKQKKVAEFLRDLEKDIMGNIIEMIPEYKNANWTTV